MKKSKILLNAITVVVLIAIIAPLLACTCAAADGKNNYIKWVDFGITAKALKDAMEIDIESYDSEKPIPWIGLLATLGVKYGGNFSLYKNADMQKVAQAYMGGKSFQEIAKNEKLYNYYKTAYEAVLGGMLGEHTEIDEDGNKSEGYGLTAYAPLAYGYGFSHYDDFGAARSYGYKRHHLGHDLMGAVGTPVIAVEAGYVEACGWNQYGGWRIGIRSFDGKRYYYYAHLRRGHPYNDIYEGKIVNAGEVIGYLGMTGYSPKEDVNNIDTPHLHFGLQLIFDPKQKDGTNQIWIDLFALTEFLSMNKSKTAKSTDGEYYAKTVRIPKNAWD